MSTAFYPLGMKNSMPSSGYNHGSTLYNKQYISWKGKGINSFPLGNASGHIRPLTNNDNGNIFQTGFGLPRPIKHYRKGRVISHVLPQNNLQIDENAIINYNTNRFVKSSTRSTSGLLNNIMDIPGGYIVKLNSENETNTNCNSSCQGLTLVANYKPNLNFLEENPNSTTQNFILCCNNEYKAKRKAIYASTCLSKQYYTTTNQYLQNRCKSIKQKDFNFLDNNDSGSNKVKPGSPLALSNTYLANCQCNFDSTENGIISKMISMMLNENVLTQLDVSFFYEREINTIQGFFNWLNNLQDKSQKLLAIQLFSHFITNPYLGMLVTGPSNQTGCQLVVYKPNNYQFAKQGAVSCSTRNLKLNVDTISTNAASTKQNPIYFSNTGEQLVNAEQLYSGIDNNILNLQQNKAPTCNTQWPLNFSQSRQFQNKKFCFLKNYKTL